MTAAAFEVVGRDEELAAIDRFLDGRSPPASALLLQGEAGIGKTTLLRAGLEAAAERGYRVLTAAPAMAETRLAYTALADLFADVLDEVLDALPELTRWPERSRRALRAGLSVSC